MKSIPASAGIGLRFPHHRHVLETRPKVPWLEVHPENYMAGGAPLRMLESIRRDYPISLHAVGLSLGSAAPLDSVHLNRLKALIERLDPGLVSDHLSWSVASGIYLGDLLPLPYTDQALDIVARNVDQAQNALGRPILIENLSTYVAFTHSTMSEAEFLAALARSTGCGILCDVNNIYVSVRNLGGDPAVYLAALPADRVGEIHLAGHAVRRFDDGSEIRIDDHGSPVAPPVWDLYEEALGRFGPVPTLIEWDTNIPDFKTLEREAGAAQARLDASLTARGRHARVA